MAYCIKCGAQLNEGASFCPSCGQRAVAPAKESQRQESWQSGGDNRQREGADGGRQGGYEDRQGYYREGQVDDESRDIASNKGVAVLAYLGLLVLVPIFAAKNSPFARYHANQGLILLIAEVIWWFGVNILGAALALVPIVGGMILFLLNMTGIAFLVFAIIGIINAASGERKPLPLIGMFTILH